MRTNNDFMMRQGEIEEEVAIEMLKVTPEHWQDIKGLISYVPVDNENYQLEFEISSNENHTDQIQLSQPLFDKAVEFYRFCSEHDQAWKEAKIRMYIDKKDDKWKCVVSYKYD